MRGWHSRSGLAACIRGGVLEDTCDDSKKEEGHHHWHSSAG